MRIAKTDASLLATTQLSQGELTAIYLDHKARKLQDRVHWWFWVAQDLSILITGPVILLMSVLIIAVIAFFDRERSWLCKMRSLIGILLTLLIAASWLILITLKTGRVFWQE